MSEVELFDTDEAVDAQIKAICQAPEGIPLLLFTGGLDSTYMLYKTLKHGDCCILHGYASQSPEQALEERRAISKILEIFRTMAHNGELHGRVVAAYNGGSLAVDDDHPFGMIQSIESTTGLKPVYDLPNALGDTVYWQRGVHEINMISGSPYCNQGISWIIHAFRNTRRGSHRRHNSVMVGYVAGDSWIPVIPAIHMAWEGLSSIVSQEKAPTELHFPMKDMTKTTIYKALQNEAPEVLEHVTFCELPTYDPSPLSVENIIGLMLAKKITFSDALKAVTQFEPCLKCASCKRHYEDIGMAEVLPVADENNQWWGGGHTIATDAVKAIIKAEQMRAASEEDRARRRASRNAMKVPKYVKRTVRRGRKAREVKYDGAVKRPVPSVPKLSNS